jgi:hypothetical protein
VEGSRARPSGPPDRWSYSSLKEVAACPRRYALKRASYPDLWDRPGYPPLPTAAALFGNVVHSALEAVVKALTEAGVQSLDAVEATEVLRGMGGLTAVVEDATSRQLAPLDANPRLDDDRRQRIARELRAQTPEARGQVQMYLSRTAIVPETARVATSSRGEGGSLQRKALGEGSHAEIRLVSDDLRLVGRVDLLTISGATVDIVDYKTGAESAGHRDQMELYALLWDRDQVANPAHLPTNGLTVAYRDRDIAVLVPSGAELHELAARLKEEAQRADSELTSSEPTPVPDESNCRYCEVRQLCPAYWQKVVPKFADVQDGTWFDYQGIVGERHGLHSWWLVNKPGGTPEFLLRTSSTRQPFAEGDRLRFLGLRKENDPETESPVASLVGTTEVFVLDAS